MSTTVRYVYVPVVTISNKPAAAADVVRSSIPSNVNFVFRSGSFLHHPAAATPEFIRICAVSAVHRQSIIECETTSSSMWTVHYCAGLRPSTNRGDESAFPTVVRLQIAMCCGLRRTFADLVNDHLRSVSRQGRVLFGSAQSCRRQLLVDTDNARLRRSIFQY